MSAEHPLVLTILGMSTVLIVLYLINIMIVVMSKVLSKKPVPAVPSIPAAPAAPAFDQEEEETLAVIMAAVTSIVGAANITGINVHPKE